MSSRDLFKSLCAIWGFSILFIFLPCDLFFRINSMTNFMKPLDILVDFSILIELFALLIVVWATLNAATNAFFFNSANRHFWVTNLAVAFAFIVFTFVNFGIKWIHKVDGSLNSDNIANTLSGNIFFVFLVVIGFIIHNIISSKFIANVSEVLRALVIICMLSFCVLCVRTLHLFFLLPPPESTQATPNLTNKPNVILITMDSLCAEDMSLYGYKYDTTPHINKLASESFVFENFYANSNWTRPAITSILTGSRPATHGLNFSSSQNIFTKNERQRKNLPILLKYNGFDTMATSGNLIYAHPWKTDTSGGFTHQPFRRSVDRLINPHNITSKLLKIRSTAGIWFTDTVLANAPFVQFVLLKQYSKNRRELLEHQIGFSGEPAEYTFKQAEILLNDAKKPFFLWVHILPPHSPYLPPDSFRHTFLPEKTLETRASQKDPNADWHKLKLRYNEMILYADFALGNFLSNIKKMGIYDNTVLIISSDHGESFEHDYKGHGGPFLYQQVVRVPLIIHLPHQKTGLLIKSNAEQIDIAPTVAELLGIDDLGWFEGESLTGAMFKGYSSKKPKYAMNLERSKIKSEGATRSIAVIEGSYKYIFYPEVKLSELYDLAVDPKELHNLFQVDDFKSRYFHTLITRDVLSKIKIDASD